MRDLMLTLDIKHPKSMRKLGRIFGALYLQPLLKSGAHDFHSFVVASYGLSSSGKTTFTEGIGAALHLNEGFFKVRATSYEPVIDFKPSGYFRYIDFNLHNSKRFLPRHDISLPGVDFLEHAPAEYIVGQPGTIILVKELYPDSPKLVIRYFDRLSCALIGARLPTETINSFKATAEKILQDVPSSSLSVPYNVPSPRRVSIIPTSDHVLAGEAFDRFKKSLKQHFKLIR